MFEVRRNHIIVTVLVLMIAVAAYLSFSETPSRITPDVASLELSPDNIPVAQLPLDTNFFNQVIETLPPDGDVAEENTTQTTEVAAMDEQDLHNIDKMQEVEVTISKKVQTSKVNEATVEAASLKTVDVSYFLEEKMLREQSRANQIEQLTEYIANQNLDQESKSKAAQNLLAIQERIEKESSSESLLRAKGFKDVFVRMDSESVDVVVNKAELTEEEVAQIEEIVHRKTGYSVTQIKITPLNLTANITKN
jgi:stage III sporulation protein AH